MPTNIAKFDCFREFGRPRSPSEHAGEEGRRLALDTTAGHLAGVITKQLGSP